MDDRTDGNIQRRRILKALGTAGTVAIAGCLGGGDDDSGGTETEGTETETETETEGESDDDSTETSIRFVHDTHFHGLMGNSEEALNIANYFGLVEALYEDADNAFAVGNGDDLHMSVESTVFDGEHMTTMLNESPVSYNAIGNHEFDNGPESFRENVAQSEFTWLSANLIDERTDDVFGAEEGAARYAVEEVDGIQIGFTGLAPADTDEVTSVGDHVEVLEPTEAAESVVADLEDEGAEIVVLLSHLASPVAEDLVAEVDGFDVVVGDHAAFVAEEPIEVDDTVLSFVGDEFDYVGQLDVDIADGDVTEYDFELHDLEELVEDGEVDPHEEIEELLVGYEEELDDELGEVIGETAVDLDVRTDTVRSEESNFGNWLTDIMVDDVDADVAIQNGGSIRSDQVYEAGDLTRRMVVDILPFPNSVVKLEVTGDQLREALEHGVSAVEDGHGRFPQVSGISYAYDPDAPEGDRIEAVTVGDEDLVADGTYELATNDFLMGGGDGYDVFTEATVLRSEDEGTMQSALAINAIEAQGTISPELEGRIDVR
ncbi:5'-nucleotidase C-terminal domain-containing protein [Halobacteria archaeon AArc-m2/3/4]|uniref:5'-nucleotidase C-terminal domain-containing protein n=1 Tax=Natronoglomus mannanivorans TaxID=2979990 RepID=A0AAP2Z0K6_9EURY|nr:5'-nucleotidase C-terminal domain-containing protein [Halobacteria archaeon AArc-xg1-1]MCU4973842.1 5'-nucleotidase C-terminal domain-containing protein [Halobacteria archaeon AArc-m2/3/4]